MLNWYQVQFILLPHWPTFIWNFKKVAPLAHKLAKYIWKCPPFVPICSRSRLCGWFFVFQKIIIEIGFNNWNECKWKKIFEKKKIIFENEKRSFSVFMQKRLLWQTFPMSDGRHINQKKGFSERTLNSGAELIFHKDL